MPTTVRRKTHDQWCDVNGAHIALFCRVEQITESTEPVALPSRLHQQSQMVGRGINSLYVIFPDNQVVSLPSQLLRLLSDAPGEC